MKYDGFYVGKTFRVMGNLMFLKTFQQQLRAGGVARFMKNTKNTKKCTKTTRIDHFWDKSLQGGGINFCVRDYDFEVLAARVAEAINTSH